MNHSNLAHHLIVFAAVPPNPQIGEGHQDDVWSQAIAAATKCNLTQLPVPDYYEAYEEFLYYLRQVTDNPESVIEELYNQGRTCDANPLYRRIVEPAMCILRYRDRLINVAKVSILALSDPISWLSGLVAAYLCIETPRLKQLLPRFLRAEVTYSGTLEENTDNSKKLIIGALAEVWAETMFHPDQNYMVPALDLASTPPWAYPLLMECARENAHDFIALISPHTTNNHGVLFADWGEYASVFVAEYDQAREVCIARYENQQQEAVDPISAA